MIDWGNLAGNMLWIIGCVMGLAAVSYAYWEATTSGESLRAGLQSAGTQGTINLAGALFCLGLAATSDTIIEIILWLVLATLFIFQPGTAVFGKQQNS